MKYEAYLDELAAGRRSFVAAVLAGILFIATPAAKADGVDWSKYEKHVQVVFSGYAGSTTLTDFPVLVRVSAVNGFDYARFKDPSGGGDLRFADANGQLLSHEIDTWNPAGESLVWVKVPSFNAATVITAYYGCANPDVVTASDVWSNDYVGVWHLNESAAPMAESSGVSTPFTEGEKPPSYAAAGAVGKSVDFSDDATTWATRLVAAQDSDLDGFGDFTIEWWSYQDGFNTKNTVKILSKEGTVRSWLVAQIAQENETSISPFLNLGDSTGNSTETNQLFIPWMHPAAGSWSHQAFSRVRESGQCAAYLNGVSVRTKDMTTDVSYAGESELQLGGGGMSSFPGKIDEVRISRVARSADWIKATRDCVQAEDFANYEAENDWAQYSHAFSVTFAGYEGNETLTDFPVLVKISETGIPGFRYADCQKANGGDLRFADAQGHLLASEVDTWDETGTSLVWVKVPSLTAATKITAYYGWSLAPSLNPTEVWANGYLGVWHMGDTVKNGYYWTMSDATGGGTTFSEDWASRGSTSPGQEGVIGKSALFGHGGSGGGGGMYTASERVLCAGATAFTFECWAWQDSHDPLDAVNKASLVDEKYTSSPWSSVYSLYESGNNNDDHDGKVVFKFNRASGGETTQLPDRARPARATWNYHAATYDNVSGKVLLNGSVAKETVATGALIPSMSHKVFLGCSGNQSNNASYVWPGKIDEVRISSVARSEAWLKASYDTVKNNATFMTYSKARETASRGTTILLR